MSKSTIFCLLALAAGLSVSGCSKEQPASPATPPQAQAGGMTTPTPHPRPTAPSDGFDLSGIERAEGGMTIAEVFAHKDHMAGEPIVVRGKVVKTNAGIMGKNWLHIRDGSGEEGTNDLTVTTIDVLPEVGDLVLVSGMLTVDKDFGMGYRYDLIIEDAEVVVEAASDY